MRLNTKKEKEDSDKTIAMSTTTRLAAVPCHVQMKKNKDLHTLYLFVYLYYVWLIKMHDMAAWKRAINKRKN